MSYLDFHYDELPEKVQKKALEYAKKYYRDILADDEKLISYIKRRRIKFRDDGSVSEFVRHSDMIINEWFEMYKPHETRQPRTGDDANKPMLTVMPDYGEAYLWIIRDDSPVDCQHLGGNIASYESWPDYEFLSSVSKDLQEDFDDWVVQFELYSDFRRFKWEPFHKRGLMLARRLKKQVGDKAIVRYVKPGEDPYGKDDEITVIE